MALNRSLAAVLMAALICPAAGADFVHEYNNGIFYYKRGELELAAKAFDRTISMYPTDPQLDAALYWGGQTYEQLGQHAKALALYKRLAENFPQSTYRSDALYSAGVAAMNAGSYAASLSYLSEAARDESANPKVVLNARVKITECLIRLGDDRRAEPALRELIVLPQLPPDRKAEAEFRLRQLLIRDGRISEANAIQSRLPKNSEYYQAEDDMRRGDAAFAAGKFGESKTWYEQVYRKSGLPPEFRAQAAYNIGRSAQNLGDHERAKAFFKETLSNPAAFPASRGDAALQLAYLYRQAGKSREADRMAAIGEQIVEEAGGSRLKDELLFFRAESAAQAERDDEAIAYLNRINETGYRENRLKGRILFESGRPSEGLEYLERAAVQAPDDDARNRVLMDLLQSQMKSKLYENALTTLSRLQRVSADVDRQIRPMRAESLYALGRFGEAASEYAALASAAPDDPAARRYRYLAALASFKDKNLSWAEKLLSELNALGGVPEGEDDDPAAFLESAIEIDKAIEFAAPRREAQLRDRLNAILSRGRHPRLYVFALDRLSAKEFYSIVPSYSREIRKAYRPADEIYGRAALAEMKAHERLGDTASAMEALDHLARWAADPGREPSDLTEEADYLRAKYALSSGDRESAREAYGSYAAKYPAGKHITDVVFQIGNLSFESNRMDDADAAFSKLIGGKTAVEIGADPSLAAAAGKLATIRTRQNRHADAAALLEMIESSDAFKNNPENRYKLGKANLSVGKIQDAISHFRSVADNPAASAEMRESSIDEIFSAYQRLRQPSAAEADYRRYAGRIKSRSVLSRAKFLMGQAAFQSGRYADAKTFFDGVQDPAGSETVLEAWVRAADCDYYLKNFESAMERYNKVTKNFPESRQAQESFYASQLCKIKLGLSGDALGGYERFLQQSPNAPQAASVALEAAKLYVQAEDVEAAERMLDIYDAKTSGPAAAEVIRMRLDISNRRGQHARFVELAKQYRKLYGMDTAMAVDVAVAATRIGDPYDPFDLDSRRDVADLTRQVEQIFSAPRIKLKTFSVDERFFDRGSRVVDAETTLKCGLKRVIFSPTRVFLVIESRAVGFLSDAIPIRIKNLNIAGTDVNRMDGAFMTGIQIGREFRVKHNQTLSFVVSIPKDQWSSDVKINLDFDFGGRDLLMFCRVQGMKEQ